jgi:chorismate synthase
MSVSPLEKPVELLTRLRPGHADLPGVIKYHQQDIRPVLERASARDTAARVAVGSIAKRFLEEFGINVRSRTLAIGGHWDRGQADWEKVEVSPVRCSDPQVEKEMITAIDEVREAGDTVGGVFEVVATGVPIGLGSHVHWDRRLSGRLAQAVMSINAVKGVEMGDGFAIAGIKGSQAHDIIEPPAKHKGAWRHKTNHAGGIEGGMTNGEPIIIRAAVKPIATLPSPLPSVDLMTGREVKAHYERSDICIVPAAGVVGEAMVALILADAMLEKFGGDHLSETLHHYQGYLNMVTLRTPTDL